MNPPSVSAYGVIGGIIIATEFPECQFILDFLRNGAER